jgi:hypothetical protein
LEVRNAAEISAMRFGLNYARQHPSDEFVIFVMGEGHILQRTNPFSVQTKISSSTQFIRREECTVERIGEYKQNERENCEAINDLTNYD